MSFTNDSVSGALPEQMNATHPKDFRFELIFRN